MKADYSCINADSSTVVEVAIDKLSLDHVACSIVQKLITITIETKMPAIAIMHVLYTSPVSSTNYLLPHIAC